MRETSKTEWLRAERGDFTKYLIGSGIDIGAGDDPLRIPDGSVRAWDVHHGDAQFMAGVEDASCDFVYSSHCLEHLHDVDVALLNWARILKPGKWLYVVVPDYVLYEKLTWPSMFNSDHKHSFSTTVTRRQVGRPNHWHMDEDIEPLMRTLGFTRLFWSVESWKFNFNAGLYDQTMHEALAQICFVAKKS
jgi:SAM-dependent methyltransferase